MPVAVDVVVVVAVVVAAFIVNCRRIFKQMMARFGGSASWTSMRERQRERDRVDEGKQCSEGSSARVAQAALAIFLHCSVSLSVEIISCGFLELC